MYKLELPFWLDGDEPTKLKAAAQAWWEKVEDWMGWPLLQLDAETCHLSVLDLLAWQRDITRYRGEPESLYRLRVKYAFVNAVDAGSVAGFKRIFRRLGIGDIEIRERQPERDWDIVQLFLDDQQLSDFSTLLDIIVHQYGRTCRRYELVGTTELGIDLVSYEYGHDQATLTARFDDDHTIGLQLASFEFNLDHMTLVAS
jgi:hypothetical protein